MIAEGLPRARTRHGKSRFGVKHSCFIGKGAYAPLQLIKICRGAKSDDRVCDFVAVEGIASGIPRVFACYPTQFSSARTIRTLGLETRRRDSRTVLASGIEMIRESNPSRHFLCGRAKRRVCSAKLRLFLAGDRKWVASKNERVSRMNGNLYRLTVDYTP